MPPDAPFSCLGESGLGCLNLRPSYALSAIQSGQVASLPSRTMAECPSKLGKKGSFIASNSSLITCESFGQRQKGRIAGKNDLKVPGSNKGAVPHCTAGRNAVCHGQSIAAATLIH